MSGLQIDIVTLHWAVHMLNGVSSPANATSTVDELAHQLRDSGARVLFTCTPLLKSACQAAISAGLSLDNIFVDIRQEDYPCFDICCLHSLCSG